MRLYVIPAGTLRIDKGAVFTPGIDDGVLIEIPVPVYLIRTDNDENVLVDTGLHPAHIDDPSHSFGLENADEVLARMQPEDRLERRLAEVGLGIADITHVVNTHLHPDHCGGNFLFPHAEIIVQREHYQEALAHPEIAGDAIDTEEHLERDLWTHCPDPETARASAQRLQQIAAQEDALLLYGHDAAQWQTLQLSPGFYD
jgi:glyoxylase-like metal-dependent hydrolase (beta-lactamase superfamily II)